MLLVCEYAGLEVNLVGDIKTLWDNQSSRNTSVNFDSPLTTMSPNSAMTTLLATYPYLYQILATLFFSCMLLFVGLYLKRRNPNGLPLPPGPKGYPIIGNLLDLPINHQWLVYDEWKKTYGKCIIIN